MLTKLVLVTVDPSHVRELRLAPVLHDFIAGAIPRLWVGDEGILAGRRVLNW